MAKTTADREARARLRTYQARTQLHDEQVRRRRRDNWIAAISVTAIFGLAIVGQLAYFGVGPGATVATATPTASSSSGENVGNVPSAALAEGREWTGTVNVNGVALGVSLDGALAPQAVASEISLIQAGFYENNTCHRLTTAGIFVLQCGDPNGDGTGGPGYSYGPIENAPADGIYPAGTIAMARQSGNGYSNGSQFFIVYQDSTIPADAAGGYTVVGHVTTGLAELQALISATGVAGGATDGAPATPIVLTKFSIQ
ncbi:MAG: peptidylprolyl isomerase [Agromyces sp.]